MKGIEVKQVTKSFDKKMILNGIGMTIEPNKIYGLLGRNGAGKSTLLSLLVNRIAPDTGEIRLDNKVIRDNDEQLSKMFLMSEVDLYPKNLKVKDVFKWTKTGALMKNSHKIYVRSLDYKLILFLISYQPVTVLL